jgi:hypothetical protein
VITGEDSRFVPGYVILEIEVRADPPSAALSFLGPSSFVEKDSHRRSERLDVSRLVDQNAAAVLEKKRNISDRRSYARNPTGETVEQKDGQTLERGCEETDVECIVKLAGFRPHR